MRGTTLSNPRDEGEDLSFHNPTSLDPQQKDKKLTLKLHLLEICNTPWKVPMNLPNLLLTHQHSWIHGIAMWFRILPFQQLPFLPLCIFPGFGRDSRDGMDHMVELPHARVACFGFAVFEAFFEDSQADADAQCRTVTFTCDELILDYLKHVEAEFCHFRAEKIELRSEDDIQLISSADVFEIVVDMNVGLDRSYRGCVYTEELWYTLVGYVIRMRNCHAFLGG